MDIRLRAVTVLTSALIVAPLGTPSVASAVTASIPAAPAVAGHGQHYDESARRVAREIDCTDFYFLGSLTGIHEAAKCNIRGERVDLITFKSAAQQRRFVRRIDLGGRRYWWANGQGALVAPVGNSEKEAAQAAARRLPGVLKRG